MKKDNNLPYSLSGTENPAWQKQQLEEQEYMINQLNKGGVVEPQEQELCKPGEHYLLVNEFGEIQCGTCLMLFSWDGSKEEIISTNWPDSMKEEKINDLLLVVNQVKNDNPPANIINWSDYRYLQGKGFRFIQRWFYDRD